MQTKAIRKAGEPSGNWEGKEEEFQNKAHQQSILQQSKGHW